MSPFLLGFNMRQQYHSRYTETGRHIWDVTKLVEVAHSLSMFDKPLDDIEELAENYWFHDGEAPSCNRIIEHIRLIDETDLSFPIILCSKGRVMDGMHRICKAKLEGHRTIKAVQFETDPAPDYINVALDSLPY